MNIDLNVKGRRGLSRLLWGVVVVTAAALLGTTGVAYAAVPNIELHRSTSANNSNNKATTAACPAGRALSGVGADLTGAGGAVLIDDLTPNAARTANTATGNEVEPVAGNWSEHSYAICSSPLAGAIRVSASTVTDGTDDKFVTVTCPAGTQVTGAGGEITGGGGNVVMDDVRPNGNPPTSVTVTGSEVDPDASWNATAYAVCANPLPGLQLVTATSASSSANKSVVAACPAGKVLTGLGGQITGGGGEVVVDDYTPSEFLSSVTVTGAEAVDIDGAFTGNWTVTAFAICATA